MEVKTGEIGRKAVVRSNEREARTGNIEREMDVVEAMTNERTMIYAKVFTRKRKKLDKTYQKIDALMRDKRLKNEFCEAG